MPRSLEEIIAGQSALAEEFENFDVEKATRRTPEEVATRNELRVAAHEVARAHAQLADVVVASRKQGSSWAVIGEALGTSGEAARQRYSKLLDTRS